MRRRRRGRAAGWAAVGALLSASPAAAGEPDAALRNWFDDPFFQVTRDDVACPVPAGPYTDARGRDEQAHRRAEKGTTCWLAGRCDRPRAHLYDADIAAAVRRAFDERRADFAGSALWVTVQGRVVYVEGCVPSAALGAAAEALVRVQPHVEQAIAIVRDPSMARPPYRLLKAPTAAGR